MISWTIFQDHIRAIKGASPAVILFLICFEVLVKGCANPTRPRTAIVFDSEPESVVVHVLRDFDIEIKGATDADLLHFHVMWGNIQDKEHPSHRGGTR